MNLYIWLNKRHSEKIDKQLQKSIDDLDAGRIVTKPWEDLKDGWDALNAKHQAQPWFVKAARNVHVFLLGWNGLLNRKLNPRHIVNKVVWSRQRSKRGWCDSDCWSLDAYITRVLSGMLAYLAEHSHAYPGEPPFDTPEKWDAHLRDLSARMGAWSGETFSEAEAYKVTQDALTEFASRLGFYWD